MNERQRGKGGRPSKGERIPVGGRLPVAIAHAMRDEAERREVSYSDVLASALADRYGLPSVLPPEAEVPADGQIKPAA